MGAVYGRRWLVFIMVSLNRDVDFILKMLNYPID